MSCLLFFFDTFVHLPLLLQLRRGTHIKIKGNEEFCYSDVFPRLRLDDVCTSAILQNVGVNLSEIHAPNLQRLILDGVWDCAHIPPQTGTLFPHSSPLNSRYREKHAKTCCCSDWGCCNILELTYTDANALCCLFSFFEL